MDETFHLSWDSRIEIDNGTTENALEPSGVGGARRLVRGGRFGVHVTAHLHALVEITKEHGR